MATKLGSDNNDTLEGNKSGDNLVGGKGNDKYQVNVAGVKITEAADGGNDFVHTALRTYVLPTNVEYLIYEGTTGATLTGNASANSIQGGEGNDKIDGGAGNDVLFGEGGNDTLIGGAGDDQIVAGAGSASIQGGAGSDTLWLPEPFENYARERTGTASVRLTSTVTGAVINVQDVEHIAFAELAYTLEDVLANAPSKWNDRLYSSANGTTLAGGAGDDTYVVGHDDVAISEAAKGGKDTVEADRSYHLGNNVENLVLTGTGDFDGYGNALDNALTGNAGSNWLDGGAGKDTMAGGTGDDFYVVDNKGDVVIEKAGDEGYDAVFTSLATYTLGVGVEDLVAYQNGSVNGKAAFTGIGNAGDNLIQGALGNDKLSGNDGDDTLVGRAGNDSLSGGQGDDLLIAGTGTDTVDGGTGTDELLLEGALADYARVRVSATDLLLTNTLTGDSVLVRNVESFGFDDAQQSLAELQWNIGSPGSDTLASTHAIETLVGGAGDDVYVIAHDFVTVTEAAKGGSDTVRASVSYELGANVEKLELVEGAENGWGNALNNTLTGNAGNNYLDGRAGADTMIGGDGDDVYAVDHAGDVIKDTSGYDTVFSQLASYRLGAGIEDLFYHSAGNFTGTGNELDNNIDGWKGNDKLLGAGGDDYLNGWGGADTLTGGTGSDTFLVWLDKPDTVTDFKSGVDHIWINVHDHPIGNGDTTIDSGELVIVATNAKNLKEAGAAAAIGTAQQAYAVGETKLFVVDNGVSSAIFKFTSTGADAIVSADELALVATLTGVKETVADDFSFGLAYSS